jgi:hypothetical protein
MQTYKDRLDLLIEDAKDIDNKTVVSDWEVKLTEKDIGLLVAKLNENPEITTLSLQHCSLTDEMARLLVKLNHINTIYLSYNNITDITWIVKNTNFEKIWLDNNNIKTTPQEISSLDLSHIQTLAINNAGSNDIKLTEAAIARQIRSCSSRRSSTASTDMEISSNSEISDSDNSTESKTPSPDR